MAGAKESPRQKLIGVMYLILLVLLALQVSSAIMEKFKYLDDSLKQANSSSAKNNDMMAESIAAAATQSGRKKDLEVLEKMKWVKAKTKFVQKEIEQLRSALIQTTGGYEDENDPNSMFVGAKDEGKVEDLMLGEKKAEKLQTLLNAYSDSLGLVIGKKEIFKPMALNAKDDPKVSARSEHKNKSFAEFNFSSTPMVAAMAVLSNLENELLAQETKALESLLSELDAGTVKVDVIFPMYKTETNTVVAGTAYKADVFLAASSSGIKPSIEIDGKPLSVNEKGVGELNFVASPGEYNAQGFCVKKWNGKIKMKYQGRDSVFSISGEYKVVKPYVDISGTSTIPMYKNCANVLKVSCPPLGADFRPSFVGSQGGEFIPEGVGQLTVVPNSPTVKLNISNNGNKLHESVMNVMLIPKPNLLVKNANGSLIDLKNGLLPPYPNRLCVDALPDESFFKTNPRDARYKVAEMEVMVIRGSNRALTPPKIVQGNCIDLSFLNNLQLKEGDRILIDVKKVLRANFRNEVEEVRFNNPLFNIPINPI